MGFRSGFVFSSVAFLYGVLFICSIYDFPLIYYSPFDEGCIEPAEKFYLAIYKGPTAVTALLHGMMGVGLLGLIAKLHRWSDMAKQYDGGSLALFMGAICMYGAVSVPNLRILADPNDLVMLERSSVRTSREKQAELHAKGLADAPAEGLMTEDERIQALRVIAAGNTIIMALLAGVVLLQVSEWYLDRQETIAKNKQREQQMAEILKQEGKKDK